MFDFTSYSTKKLIWLNRIFSILSIICIAVIPICIIAHKYGLFVNAAENKISGYALIFIIIIAVFLYKYLDRLINYINPLYLYGKKKGKIYYLKYVLSTIKHLFIPVMLIVILFLCKKNIELAFNTFLLISISICVSALIEGMICEPIRYVISIDQKGVENTLMEKRQQ